ncbi:hypothetical protein T492DRAFT_843996 [Pavlovales sp. CCMP2436]|nr:hypothetical protein T492DRAFT_843996 [Pavlovales sp. CCMP2436]
MKSIDASTGETTTEKFINLAKVMKTQTEDETEDESELFEEATAEMASSRACAASMDAPSSAIKKKRARCKSATNNEVKYTRLIVGLDRAKELGVRFLAVTGDSELIIKQMKGQYQVKAPNLLPLHQQAKVLAGFMKCTFVHVLHALNTRADALATAGRELGPSALGAGASAA